MRQFRLVKSNNLTGGCGCAGPNSGTRDQNIYNECMCGCDKCKGYKHECTCIDKAAQAGGCGCDEKVNCMAIEKIKMFFVNK